MLSGIKLVKGMKDVLPEEMLVWEYVESQLTQIIQSYGYQEIRMPILEQTDLFKRAIGDITDIVEKEMYTFIDKGGDSLTLRPESTAQTVRAMIEHSLLRGQTPRVWYHGPMFRRENPQKGRYRQFYQIGVEAFGLEGPDVDVEQILMLARLWQRLGLQDKITLEINSLGTLDERKLYREALITYFKGCTLDEDSTRRLNSNPLRILDSKNPEMKSAVEQAPTLLEYLGSESKQYFEKLQSLLRANQIEFKINPRIVRGLDYYSHCVYEWVGTGLGAQGSVCGGGRYNDLVRMLGGPETPAVGFALGVERLVMLVTENQLVPKLAPVDAYFIADDKYAESMMLLAEKLRQQIPQIRILMNCSGGSFKSQFKRADKSGAAVALILGDDEVANQTITIKSLRSDVPQQTLSISDAIQYLGKL